MFTVDGNGDVHFSLLPIQSKIRLALRQNAASEHPCHLTAIFNAAPVVALWRDLVIQGQMTNARMSMTISMVGPEYNVLAQWEFLNAWPSKVSGPMVPPLGAEVGRQAIEELTIVHEGMERVK